ncbi:MAG: hypothetical protein OEW60_04785 [Thiovulaceae bacterium]|nr:hypothetical protein [Sulfurimonadaceae bacterium]
MKSVLIFLLQVNFLFSAIDVGFFNTIATAELKKDQFLTIVVYDQEEKRLLQFRWTLFHNKGLVTHTNYRGHPMQELLYAKYRQDTIKIDIALRDNEGSFYHPYLLITFLGYDYKQNRANFEIRHKDLQEQTRIEIKE